MRYAFRPGIPDWAREFDAWAEDALSRFDVDALIDWKKQAPGARMALPTWEHYAPVLVAAGAAADERPRVRFPITDGGWIVPSAVGPARPSRTLFRATGYKAGLTFPGKGAKAALH